MSTEMFQSYVFSKFHNVYGGVSKFYHVHKDVSKFCNVYGDV